MNKILILGLAVMLICGTVFATYVFTLDCSNKTTASLLPTLVASKSKLDSYNFQTNEYTFSNSSGIYKATNKIGCMINK